MKIKLVLGALVILMGAYFLGPKPETPMFEQNLPTVSESPEALEQFIADKERRHHLKPGTEAKIIWVDDSLRNQTEYSLVYLHGFSASHHEGFPLHRNLARAFGCNLYLARLHQHGIDTTDALYHFSAEGFYRSALEALAIGQRIGQKVILVSTSTGCTAALKMASEHPQVHALINLSPNVRINDPFAFLLNDPWGSEMAHLAMGGDFRYVDGGPEYAKYWNDKYRTEALVELQQLIETTMTRETFEQITQPVFNGYYFKDDENQDPVVKVSAIRWMHELLSTPDSLKREYAFADAGNHVLASPIKSNDVEGVEAVIQKFMIQVIGMKVVESARKDS